MNKRRWWIGLVTILCFGLSQGKGQNYITKVQWQATFPDLGTFSSPRLSDLNGDEVLDIILGAGRQEFQACDTAVIALDGKTGAILWRVGARDQIFGTPTLYDITRDGVDDVFICGRSAELMAINGAKGELIWRFLS